MLPTENHWKLINEKISALDEKQRIATTVRDLFALGCYLSSIGKTKAGRKTVDTALTAIDLDKTNKSLFIKIMDSLKGNEIEFHKRIEAHSEINDLFEN